MKRNFLLIVISVVLVFVSLLFRAIMTFNDLTPLGTFTFYFLLAGYSAALAYSHRHPTLPMYLVISMIATMLFALMVCFQFSKPRENAGLFVDTSYAWRKYGHAR